MKKTMAIVFMTIISAGFAIAQNGAGKQELIKLQKEWRAAIERGDRDTLNRIIADDYTTRNGTWNKAQYIEQAMKDKANDDLNLKNAASAPANYSVKFKGGEMKRGGRWQVVSSESNPIPDGQVLRHIEREWEDANKNKDKAWLESNLADEYTAINSRGKMFNKTEDIADTLSNADTITSAELSNMQVRVHGDTAVVTGRLHRVGKDKNGSFDWNYMFTDTFVKRDGRWQVIATQATLVAPETTAKN